MRRGKRERGGTEKIENLERKKGREEMGARMRICKPERVEKGEERKSSKKEGKGGNGGEEAGS